MNEEIDKLIKKSGFQLTKPTNYATALAADGQRKDLERFAELIIEETLKQVDQQCYGRGENQWYYEDDKRWIRLHFGYGELKK